MPDRPRYKKSIYWLQAGGGPYPYHLHHRRAGVLSLTGKWDQAGQLAEANLKNAALTERQDLAADCKIFLAGLLSNQSRYQQALGLAREALDFYRSACDSLGMCQGLLALSEAYKQLGEYQEVIGHCQKAAGLARSEGNDNMLARALRNIGIIFLRQGKYPEAREYFEKDLEICRKLGDLQGQARAFGNLGLVHDNQADRQQAISCQQSKLEICRRTGDKQGVAYANMSLGAAYVNLNQLDRARQLFQNSLDLSRELGDLRNICLACGNLSAVGQETGDYEQALKYSLQQLAGAEETKDKYNQLFALGSLGVIYKKLKQEAKAEEYFDRAITLCRETGQQHDLAINLYDKANLCHFRELYAEAEKLNAEALEIATAINAQNVLFPARTLKAKLDARRNPEEGLRQLLASLKESQDYEELAPLNLEIFRMTGEQVYKKTALSLYTMLNSKSARIEYREALEELRGG